VIVAWKGGVVPDGVQKQEQDYARIRYNPRSRGLGCYSYMLVPRTQIFEEAA
jgi:hypothetical protein